MPDKHKLEISTDETGSGKLIIDGHDLSNFAHEIRVVLVAGKTPQVQVDLYGIDGLGAILENAGLVLNVYQPGELDKSRHDAIEILRDMKKGLKSLSSSLGSTPSSALVCETGRAEVSGVVYRTREDGAAGMYDPRG